MPVEIIIINLIIVLFLTNLAFSGLACLKKSRRIKKFAENSNQLIAVHYKGAKRHKIKEGMHNLIIIWDRPFRVMIGLKLNVPFIKSIIYYGHAESIPWSDAYLVVIRTFLGNNPCEFKVLMNKDLTGKIPWVIWEFEEELLRGLNPTTICPPHLWQRFEF